MKQFLKYINAQIILYTQHIEFLKLDVKLKTANAA